ncbi:MAG: hypothetical protein IKQ70_04900 [Bacteroidales bacterium]|nr:hypothetical protein [Bacteroidales bacterium]
MNTNSPYTPLCEMIRTISLKESKKIVILPKLLKGGLRFVKFVKTKTELSAAQTIHRIAPNLVYPEKAYIAAKGRLSALFSFGSLASKNQPDVLRNDVSLAEGFVLKSAQAYRVNYSRLMTACARTLAQGRCELLDSVQASPEVNSLPVVMLEGVLRGSPVKKSLMIPFNDAEIWLINRGNSFYIIGINICDTHLIVDIVNSVLHHAGVYLKNFSKSILFNINKLDMFFEAWLKDVDASSVSLDGCAFPFSPSAPDVIGYADMKFDEVKRMDVDVTTFKNAVFDFGTHIDEIIEDTYNLYPEYHNGAKAFDAAVERWKNAE